jgi:hypothetical protein
VQLNARYKEPIFDESIPDPVFDRESGYKGAVPYGFSRTAELLNGRAAMMGFVVVCLQELFAGRGVLQQYGLPYDEGAIVPPTEGFVLPPVVALVLAFIVTVLATYGGAVLGGNKGKPTMRGASKLPFIDKLPF